MKRHPALVLLSHDHHHALVQAKRLREGGEPRPFVRFYLGELVRHFREEEEAFFPLLVSGEGEVHELVAAALVQHAQLHAGARALARGAGDAAAVGALLDAHVRLEERQLFPALEQVLPELDAEPAPLPEGPLALDLGGGLGGVATDDLNATVVVWDPDAAAAEETVNAERDVLFVPLAGSGTVTVDGEPHRLDGRRALVVPKGARRRIAAGEAGLRYVTAHLRRPSTFEIGRARRA